MSPSSPSSPVLISCDESGYEGDRLVDGVTDVFAHAGVGLDGPTAAGTVAELRRRIRSPALEYKANHLLRAQHRGALEWLLGRDGPISGAATVHLVDKAALAAARLGQLLLDGDAEAALAGHRDAPRELWTGILAAFNAVLRARRVEDLPILTDRLRSAAADLAATPGATGALAAGIRSAAPRAAALREAFLADPMPFPPLDPLLPAVVATVARWSPAGRPVTIVHDRQTTLTDARVATLLATTSLAGLRLTDSRTDARVQVADFLAGVAYRIASDALAGRADATLVELLRPYVDPGSLWSDRRSGSALGIGEPRGG